MKRVEMEEVEVGIILLFEFEEVVVEIAELRNSKRKRRRESQMMAWMTEDWTTRSTAEGPYMDLMRGTPTTRALVRVEREKEVMDHEYMEVVPSKNLAHTPNTTTMMSFEMVSAAINLMFILKGSM